MPDLLIHSMAEFADLILPALEIAEAREIVEIGAEYGGMSMPLSGFVNEVGGRLVCIDPAPKPEFRDWVVNEPRVRHDVRPSLTALEDLAAADAWLIDGDHNWYTVHHELKAIERICRGAGRPPLVFLHDVGWPCARRDAYYDPSRIPPEYRNPHAFDGGAVLDRTTLVRGGGFRGMGAFAFAERDGGPRNGVLTAVEDFLRDLLDEGRELALVEIPAVFGLGVLFAMDAPWSARLAAFLLPYHRNPLLARLEENRLRNYLRVIELQDRDAAGRAGG